MLMHDVVQAVPLGVEQGSSGVERLPVRGSCRTSTRRHPTRPSTHLQLNCLTLAWQPLATASPPLHHAYEMLGMPWRWALGPDRCIRHSQWWVLRLGRGLILLFLVWLGVHRRHCLVGLLSSPLHCTGCATLSPDIPRTRASNLAEQKTRGTKQA